MADFVFLKNSMTGKPVISAPHRAKRTEVGEKQEGICPFCPGNERDEDDVYHVGLLKDWQIRVIPNKFPFTPHHELVIHSPDHHKNFDELPFEQVELIFKTYRERFLTHQKQGYVYIFHNRGHAAGESVHHPHTQITVVPKEVQLEIQPLDKRIYKHKSRSKNHEARGFHSMIHDSLFMIRGGEKIRQGFSQDILETDKFLVFCPSTSEWPDEVWVAPKKQRGLFGSIADTEVTDLAFVVSRLIQILDLRHGAEFPFNFYIYPGKNWYLRIIPRQKILGGFEVGTGISVNTQDPKETFAFILEHFWKPDHETIKTFHAAVYRKSV
ncbi:MAG TPA: hypothetical protein VLF20_05625 [Patescibacteria group bacterium]|nr:hypothetical protein [Patescibacteria group bacterium]